MAKSTVGFFVISTHLGGAEKSLLDFLQSYDKTTLNPLVISVKNRGPLLEALDKEGISHCTLAMPQWYLSLSRRQGLALMFWSPLYVFYSLFYLLKIKKLIAKQNIEVAHSTGLKFHILLGSLALLQNSFRLIVHIRDIFKNPILICFFHHLMKRKNIEFIVNSKASLIPLQPMQCPVVYNGFDDKRFHPGPSDLKKRLKLPPETFLVGMVGVIARWKGQREFLQAAKKVCDVDSSVHFLIVGDEIYDTSGDKGELTHLKEMTQTLDIVNNVHFLGFQTDTLSIYRGLDLLVHNSIEAEPFGRVIVEAMLSECPVTVSNQGGPLEIIDSEVDGLVHPTNEMETLAQQILNLKGDQLKRQNMARKGRQKALSFSMKNYTEQLEQILVKQH